MVIRSGEIRTQVVLPIKINAVEPLQWSRKKFLDQHHLPVKGIPFLVNRMPPPPEKVGVTLRLRSAICDSVGISAAELERKLSALAMSEESSQKSPPVAQKSPPPVTGQKGQGAQKNEGQKKDVKANQSSGQVAEDGVHTSKRSRNPAPVAGSSSAATTSEVPIPPNQKVTRGAVSNKVTKPNGRGETLRAAVEAKQS